MKKKDFKIHSQSAAFFSFGSSILAVIVLRFIPVYFTPLMFIRTTQQIIHGEDIKWKHSWIPKENISPHLPMAVIASEDNRFAEHNGFDFKEIEKALEEKQEPKTSSRCQYYQPTDSQKHFFVACFFLDQKRT